MARNLHNLHSFEGKARVIIELPGKSYNGFSNIFMKLPDSVYVKTEAILGIDIGGLFLDQRFFAAYAPRDNILYYGEAESLDLRDFLEIEIDTDELFEVFTGLNQIVVNDTSKLIFAGGKFVVTTQLEQQSLIYEVDPEKYIVTKSQLVDAEGKTILLKEYRRLRTNKGVVLPQIIKLTRPQARERITVYYTNQKINKKIAAEKFKIKPAKNAKKVYWGDTKRPAIDRNLQKINHN
ncbi:DUF4292 domain-containing protein [candidate division KSB1 bacterium]|nr:DUF4292 domain-containing protein [candidate division KSB1 bacterium]